MSGSLKFFLLLLILTLCFVVGTGLTSSLINAVLVAAFILVMFLIARPMLMPAGYGVNKLRTLTLIIGMSGISGASALKSLWPLLWTAPLLRDAPQWVKDLPISFETSLSVSLIFAAVIIAVFYFTRDRTVSGGHPVALKKDFPDESFPQKLKAFCRVLERDLAAVDLETNWSPNYYTELQAEVEIRKSRGAPARRKIMNLQDAIRRDRTTQTFLVLGVPGAGKSVALRKLAQDMLDEVKTTQRIPIYVNLREWLPKSTVVDGRTMFSVEDLEAFITKNLIRRGDVFTKAFVDEHFRNLWSSGRLFFIFDSFDEISPLLDARENSDVIHALSSVIAKFIGSHTASRGLLASRMFRRPTAALQADKVLEIRPLSETDISHALSRYPRFTPALRNRLFSQRQDLMPLARNPFIMALLGEWIAGNEQLPVNQADIYKNYIDGRLALCDERLRELGMTAQEVVKVTTDIAWFVFHEPTLGLEAPVKLIDARVKTGNVEKVLEILRFARIARVTSGEEMSFAFVHRRFLEYFVTTRFLSHPEAVPDSHIPTDSRGRDALVLYAQLCSEAEANRLAQLCWHEIEQNFAQGEQHSRAIHCLRFLIDAFGSRRDILQPFEPALSAFISDHVKEGQDILSAKICLEATGLLREEDAEPVLASAIVIADEWLQETAFRACRHLARVKPALEEELKRYVLAIPETRFWPRRKAMLLSLSLSDALSHVYRTARLRVWNMKTALVSTLLLTVMLPFITLFCASYALAVACAVVLVSRAGDYLQRKKPKKAASKAPVPARASLFLQKDLFSATVTLFRWIASVVVLVMSVAGLYSATLAPLVTPFSILFGVTGYSGWLAAVNVLLSIMLLDWAEIARFVRAVVADLFNLKKWLSALSILAFSVIFVALIYLGITYLSQFPLAEPIFSNLIVFLLFAVLASVGIVFLIAMIDNLKDIKMLKEYVTGTTIARTEIAHVFSKCVSDYGRMRFVNRLDNEGVSASGAWPADFSLTVGRRPPYTALSRLEERWLGLDR